MYIHTHQKAVVYVCVLCGVWCARVKVCYNPQYQEVPELAGSNKSVSNLNANKNQLSY